MGESARAIFEALKTGGDVPLLHGVKGTYRFDIDGVGSWRLTVDDGAVWVREGPGEAECVIGLSEEVFVKMARGEKNLMTALLRSEIRFEGDRRLLKAYHGMLPAPPAATDQEQRAA
jgi:putative sterol carrier protein